MSTDAEHKELMAAMVETGKTMLRVRHELGADAFWQMVDNNLQSSRNKAVTKMYMALLAEAAGDAQ